MGIHIAHVVTLVVLVAAFALGAASLGLSILHLKGTGPPSQYSYFTSYTNELLPFKTCTDTIGAASAAYTNSQCQSWDDYFKDDGKFCPTIGTTGNATTKDMLSKVTTAGITGGIYVAAVFTHIVVFVLWALAIIPTRLALIPMVLVAFIVWIICLVSWAQLYFACDQSYCVATENLLANQLLLTSTECYFADGFRTLVASFVLFLGSLVPICVCSPPTVEITPVDNFDGTKHDGTPTPKDDAAATPQKYQSEPETKTV